MANLLEEASILLTPTAYNDGKMLSVKPTNGDGDFIFTRNSAATRVNAQGLVENVQILSSDLVSNGDFSQEGAELVTNGDFATDSDWNLRNAWVISNGICSLTSPNSDYLSQSNVLTANRFYKLTFDIVVNSGSLQPQFFDSGFQTIGTYTTTQSVEVYFLSSSSGTFYFKPNSFDGSIDNVSVKEVGQDWILGTGVIVADNKLTKYDPSVGNTSASQSGVFTVGKTYKYKLVVSGDLTASDKVVGFVTDFTSAGTYEGYWTANSTSLVFSLRGSTNVYSIDSVSVKEITDDTNLPRIDYTDGCGSWLLEPQSTNLYLNSDTIVTQSNATSESTYTVSFYGTGTVTFSGTYTGTLVGTGLNDRASVTFTTTSGTLVSTINGTCTKGQLENLTYPTSYIPTQGASSTRLKDIATNSGNASLINSEQGVFYAEISYLADDDIFKIISLNNDSSNSSNNAINIGFSRNNNLYIRMVVNGTAILSSTNIYATKNQYYQVAIKFNSLGDNAVWIDGVEVLSNTTSFTYPVIIDNLSFDYNSNGGLPFYGKTKALAVFKTALTDEQLTALTTI